MSQNKFLTITLGSALALVIVVGGIFAYKHRKIAPHEYQYVKTTASKGQAVDGFPKNLILDKTAISQSYSFNYQGGAKQYTAVITSTKSVSDIYNDYLDLFTKSKYLVGNQNLQTDFASMYVATPNNENINLVVQNNADNKTRMVTITYTQR